MKIEIKQKKNNNKNNKNLFVILKQLTPFDSFSIIYDYITNRVVINKFIRAKEFIKNEEIKNKICNNCPYEKCIKCKVYKFILKEKIFLQKEKKKFIKSEYSDFIKTYKNILEIRKKIKDKHGVKYEKEFDELILNLKKELCVNLKNDKSIIKKGSKKILFLRNDLPAIINKNFRIDDMIKIYFQKRKEKNE